MSRPNNVYRGGAEEGETAKWVRDNWDNYGSRAELALGLRSKYTYFNADTANALIRKIQSRLVAEKGVSMTKPQEPVPASAKPGVSVNAFLGKLDYDKNLDAAIRKHCQTQFVRESDIRALAQIPQHVWRKVADMPRFDACKFREGDIIWWSSPENIGKVKAKRAIWGIV